MEFNDSDLSNFDNMSFNMTNITLEQYLLMMRGPKQLPLNIAVPFTIFNALIFVTGIVGNISVCIVIIKNSSMHTATNYYLFSLAVSDLTLLLFGLPNDITVYWHQYPWTLGVCFCKIRALVSESASYVSVLTIVAFSMERYLAICHPLHLCAMSGFQRAVRIIAILWIIALASAVPVAAFTTVHFLDFPPGSGNEIYESAFCGMLEQPKGWPISEISTIVFFIGPMLVIMVLYIRMGLKIRKIRKGVKGSVHRETRHHQSKKAIIRMLAAVVIAFFICWAPFHAQRLAYIYGQNSPHYLTINEWMFYITGLLYYVSSTVNPILYNVMSNRYRVAFRETLCCNKQSSKNGICREHSSFRETVTLHSRHDTQLVRVRSIHENQGVRSFSRYERQHSGSKNSRHHQNSVQWQGLLDDERKEHIEIENDIKRSDVVVMITPSINGKAKTFTSSTNETTNHILNNLPNSLEGTETCI